MAGAIAPFSNHLPVRIHFGDGISSKLGEVLASESVSRALVVLDEGLEEVNPPVARCLREAESADVHLARHVKGRGEPTLEVVGSAAAALAESGAEAVVAVGGGSVMDTAKAARLCLTQGQSVSAFLASGSAYRPPSLPLICLPTTAGTGSEVSGGAVLTDATTHLKTGIANPLLRAQYALVDPVFTHSLPPEVTAQTGIDALAQAIAAIVVKVRTPVGNAIALEATRLAGRSLVAVVRNGSGVAARSEMACASLMAGLAMNISDCGAEHSLAQALGGSFALPHGLTVGLVLAETLERERGHVPELLERVADALGVPDDGSRDGSRAVLGVRRILADIGIPVLREVGVTRENLDDLTERAMNDFLITQSPVPWTAAEVRRAYESALQLPSRRATSPV